MESPDKSELKERERSNWTSAAEGWRRRDELLRKGGEPVTERMLELSGISSGSRLLDIASGTGEPAISAAQIVGESGKVIGTDLVDEMLAVAREKIGKMNLGNIEFHCIDAETLDFTTGSFDAVTIRWGLMFMPEPQACLAAAHKALKQNGHISLACWAAPEKNPFVGVLIKTLSKYMDIPAPPPGTPGIFAFSDSERLQDVLTSAGFRNIVLEEMAIDVIEVDDGRAYWEAISDLAAPVMALVRQLEESVRSDYIDEVIKVADAMKQGETLRMRGTTWIVSAVK
ncbi:ubiquinone/menaquinone biosynthesis C-methyltransferase UbiE [bacterium BMS3Abin11]|nr:ubiquinone/menaquinone biosynthesis C-methyltransferase UbiE [bacterium BMS3Abin11]